ASSSRSRASTCPRDSRTSPPTWSCWSCSSSCPKGCSARSSGRRSDMRFIFKTGYEQDIRLAKHGGHVFWYGLLGLVLIAAPWLLAEYLLAQLTFILIYGVVGLGLMLLAGY